MFKSRSVPYSMRERVVNELDMLEKQGVYKKVTYSNWESPIVPVTTDTREPLRICAD